MTHHHGNKVFAIDKIPAPPRTSAPVQVLVLGLSRTGTFSMTDALAKLGYKSYHMKEAFANFGRNHMEYWREALSSKYENRDRKYCKAEFEKLLEGYTTMIGPYTQILTLVLSFWTQGKPYDRTALRDGFLAHYEHIRSVVPPSNLLEFRSEDGWGPLCKFLDKDVPDGPYPRSNEGSYTADRHWWAMPIRTLYVLGKALALVVPVVAALAAVWWARSGGRE